MNKPVEPYVLSQLAGYRDRLRTIARMEHPVDRRVRASQVVSFVLGLLSVYTESEVGSLLTEIDQLFNECVFGDAVPLPRPDSANAPVPQAPVRLAKRGRRPRRET